MSYFIQKLLKFYILVQLSKYYCYRMKNQEEHRFVSHRQVYQKVPHESRSEFRSKLLELIPMQGQPKIFKTQYTNKAWWQYQQGIKLNYYFAKQSQLKQPKAIFFSFHGLNSHGGSSGYLGTNIAANCPVDVYSLDFKNFGLSEGPMKGFIPTFEEQLNEAESFVDYIMQSYKSCQKRPKVIISGLSFGGTICFKLAITKPQKYDYIAFFSPGLREVPEALPIMKKIGKAIGFLFPTLRIINPKFTDGNKYNMEKHILADQKNYTGKTIPGTIRTVLNAIEEVSTQFSKLKTPYILFQSGSDKLVDVFAPLDLEKESQVQDKTTIYCKNMWHSVYSQEEIEHIVPILIRWINKRVK